LINSRHFKTLSQSFFNVSLLLLRGKHETFLDPNETSVEMVGLVRGIPKLPHGQLDTKGNHDERKGKEGRFQKEELESEEEL
jgi:hypothetical protein